MGANNPPGGKPGKNDRGKVLYDTGDRQVRPGADEADPDFLESFKHPGLSVVDDDASSKSPIKSNEKGVQRGYNPYNSGALYKKTFKKKRDMRALSKWIELKKKMDDKKD
jgi:hypothetical protein